MAMSGSKEQVTSMAMSLRRRLFEECDRWDWRGVVVLSAAVKGKVRAFPGHERPRSVHLDRTQERYQ
jgi:hypothetical protein